ncbi:MAG: DNA methyltransferase [Bacteroidetes bacterium]|nr:DNA methyltransferase [Bacteroidota bacterium]
MTRIVCLGKDFHSDEERREYFRNELRSMLPELKKIEGFPIGEDEDIIALSDPPYYTACPNPWLNEFIAEWEKDKADIPGRKKEYHVDEPYASDVSEGKNNPIYNAHSYHTKVPHPAIMRYILHYTQPGDIVLDGFAGTGMTGVAAQLCGHPDSEIKYRIDEEFKNQGLNSPQWGERFSIIGDISPIASFISYNYNNPIEYDELQNEVENILINVENTYEWLYQTKHSNGKIAKINYTIWSDVFVCGVCADEIVFWDAAVDSVKGEIRDVFTCPHCNATHSKRTLERKWITIYDKMLQKSITQNKSIPVLINYSYNGKKFNKKLDLEDFELIDKTEAFEIHDWFPIDNLPDGYNTRQPIETNGYLNVHHFYTKRNLIVLSYLWKVVSQSKLLRTKFSVTALNRVCSKLAKISFSYYFHGGGGAINGGVLGTLYVTSLGPEINVIQSFKDRIRSTLFNLPTKIGSTIVNTTSCSNLQISDNSIDYIFTDPPFGSNIMYSELSFLWESWLKIRTNNKEEAIENKVQGKSLLDYQNLMTKCFVEYYRILKPGKWMTVEFSNTSAAVWNGIQTGLQKAGFVIANVAGLDKKQGSFKAVTTPTAVKQDLVISCYKPSSEFENKFKTLQGDVAVWDFVLEHLHHLPAHIRKDNNTTAIVERSPKIIFDRLITFYIMRGLPVPIDARDFQDGLKQRFVERDSMFFTAEQAAEYDEKKAKAPQFIQLSLIVSNESDAIEWLKDRVRKQAQKYQDIMPDFRIATQSLRKGDTLPELQDILNENFIQESDGKWRSPDSNEAKDREALRTKVLLKEFNGYVTTISQLRAKKIKEVRVEALRAGFKNCWEQKDFKYIVSVGDMIPQNILLEDEQLLMYYDIAKDRI